MKIKKLLTLIITLAIAVCVFAACDDDAKTTKNTDKDNTEQADKEKNKKDNASSGKTDSKRPEDDNNSEPATTDKEPVPVEHIEEAEDIQTGDELTTLIEESNDPNTTPERREEILGIIGEYLEGIEGEVITIPAE